jgi:hypothetical protein
VSLIRVNFDKRGKFRVLPQSLESESSLFCRTTEALQLLHDLCLVTLHYKQSVRVFIN